ncbi:MAG: diaminopimelate epimerase [Oscillospiraceae bacterium]|nr:diaminopimelate epimerase [Oscillospiraceae bacterium]
MQLRFTKMQGCGNDYIYFNCLELEMKNPESLAESLSDRNFGIGGDGIVLILPSNSADAKMRMFNADGSEGKMCGNAIRCVAKYLYDNNIVRKRRLSIETLSGIKTLDVTIENGLVASVKVDMGKAVLQPDLIPVRIGGLQPPAEDHGPPPQSIINEPVAISGVAYAVTCVSMGNPHAVVFCDDVEDFAVTEVGPLFENHPMFPERVNTEFVEIVGKNHLKMRVWERGSGETLACGTGACASAVAAVLNGHCGKGEDITVSLTGGDLTINYTDDSVIMIGGCAKVFEGEVDLRKYQSA